MWGICFYFFQPPNKQLYVVNVYPKKSSNDSKTEGFGGADRKQFAVAFSGGGVRAAAYHCGLLCLGGTGGGSQTPCLFQLEILVSGEFYDEQGLLGGRNSNIFGIFTPKFGEDEPILTHMFQLGWFNHQPVQ